MYTTKKTSILGSSYTAKDPLCVAVCCSVLQCVAVCCGVLQCVHTQQRRPLYLAQATQQRIHMCCSVLQCVAVCCSVLQCAAVRCSVLQCVSMCVAVHCHESLINESRHTYLHMVDMCCSVLQCVAVCCSVLQCVSMCVASTEDVMGHTTHSFT